MRKNITLNITIAALFGLCASASLNGYGQDSPVPSPNEQPVVGVAGGAPSSCFVPVNFKYTQP